MNDPTNSPVDETPSDADKLDLSYAEDALLHWLDKFKDACDFQTATGGLTRDEVLFGTLFKILQFQRRVETRLERIEAFLERVPTGDPNDWLLLIEFAREWAQREARRAYAPK